MSHLRILLAAGLGVLAGGALGACSEAAEDIAVQSEDAYLDEEQRLRLFNLEQADLRLGLTLKPLCESIKESDLDSIREVLAAGFRGQVPSLEEWESASADGNYRFQHVTSYEKVDGDGFLRWIEEIEGRFGYLETVSFPRYHNDESILGGADASSESEGAFRIAGTSREGGPLEISGRFVLQHRGMDDAFEELTDWVRGLHLEDVRLIGFDRNLFVETTYTCGVETEGLRDNWDTPEEFHVFYGGAFLEDVNGDGHLDLLVTEEMSAQLYLGAGDGTFTPHDWKPKPFRLRFASEKTGDFLFAAIFDATGNGKNEVLCGGTLYRWAEKKETLVPLKGATRLPNADTTVGDFDRDGLVDLYVLNCGPPAEGNPQLAWFDNERVTGLANVLLKNMGGGRFNNVTEKAGASPGHGRTFASVFFYADDDMWPDIFGANEFGRNVLLGNQGDGTFKEADSVDPIFGGFSMGVSSGDLDGDGKTDLYVSNMYSKAGHRVFNHLDLDLYPEEARPVFQSVVSGNRFYRSNGDLTFEDLSKPGGVNAVGWGWSGAIADFDLDGWLDVYAPCGHRSVSRDDPDG